MSPQLHQALIAARTNTYPPRRPLPAQPTLLGEAAPLLSILAAIAALVALGASTVIA